MFNSFNINLWNFKLSIHYSGISFFIFIGLSLLGIIQVKAQGNLLVDPHRVIFEGEKKLMNVSLINSGKDSADYSISFLQYKMSDDGSYEEIISPDPGQNFADKYIRLYPRIVKLGPNETQIVKLQMVRSEELQPGEYRSHLYFRTLPMQKALGEEVANKDSSGISIKIIPVFGVSIPVIIRVGESTSALKITDLMIEKAVDALNKLSLTINRTGNMSVIFDITVTHIATDGKVTQIGFREGTVIYTPNLLRKFKMDLENKTPVDLSKGTIHVACTTKNGKSTVILAEADLVL